MLIEPDDDVEYNQILDEATLHVKQAADQRRVCNLKIQQAEKDYVANKYPSQRRYIIVMDYSQNI